jgi:signal transduction histidine kinase
MVKMFSHDLRGPLVSMGAALRLLKKGVYGEMEGDVADEIDKLFTMVTGLIGTVEDFLGKAFSVEGDLYMPQEVLHLKKDLIEPVLLELSKDILGHSIMIDDRLSVVPDNRLQIQGNRFWLKAIFRNLLKNAIKYGERGSTIAIGFKTLRSQFRINVYNSGTPVPKEYRDLLFTKFGRISARDDGNGKGMGLGLYLVKEIIEKHGGKIWYEGKEHGSNFVFTLPRN